MSLADIPFGTQVALWGYALQGDVLERSALHSEVRAGGDAPAWCLHWDRTARDLEGIERWDGDHRLPVPEWWALGWVVVQMVGDSIEVQT